MDETVINPAEEEEGTFELGQILGSRRAFSAIAGRCSAADAECLRRICEQKLFKHKSDSWDEFCPRYIGMSKASANRIIRLLDDFGPDYFELAQLTRITPDH